MNVLLFYLDASLNLLLIFFNLVFCSCSFFVTKEVLEGKFYFLFGRKICLASLAQL